MGFNLVGGCAPKPLLLIILAIKLMLHTFSSINILVLTIQEGHMFAHSHSPVCMCLIFLTIILLFFLPPSELSPFKLPPSFPHFHITP
ncbi:hypothetical protein BJV74DRAFT_873476, partial [Russula compacta]